MIQSSESISILLIFARAKVCLCPSKAWPAMRWGELFSCEAPFAAPTHSGRFDFGKSLKYRLVRSLFCRSYTLSYCSVMSFFLKDIHFKIFVFFGRVLSCHISSKYFDFSPKFLNNGVVIKVIWASGCLARIAFMGPSA